MIAQGTRCNATRDEVVQTACELTRVVYNSAAMEPHIQYAKTADGVSIAFWTLGPAGLRRDSRTGRTTWL
jgi:hypothetical protein